MHQEDLVMISIKFVVLVMINIKVVVNKFSTVHFRNLTAIY